MAIKNPFDSIQEPDRPDSNNKRREHPGILICEACGARLKVHQHGKRIVRAVIDKAIIDHVCEYEEFPYYNFNDPRTIVEQRRAYRDKFLDEAIAEAEGVVAKVAQWMNCRADCQGQCNHPSHCGEINAKRDFNTDAS